MSCVENGLIFFSLLVPFNLCEASGSLIIPLLPGSSSWFFKCNLTWVCFYCIMKTNSGQNGQSTLAVFSWVFWTEDDKLFVKMCYVCRHLSCGSVTSFHHSCNTMKIQKMCFYFGLLAIPAHATAGGCSGRMWLMPLNIQCVSFGSEISTHMSRLM